MAKRSTGQASSPSPSAAPTQASIFPGRVLYTILDDKEDSNAFNQYGEWGGIGCIFWASTVNTNSNPTVTDKNFARPLFPNQKHYPLKNEVVYLIGLPSNASEKTPGTIQYYYFHAINFWNNNHHNAIPDPIIGAGNIPESQQRDYIQTEAGAVRRVTDGGTEIDLGTTFTERLTVKTLLPYQGDIIYEGRWGQGLRFGSTVKNANIPNEWSKDGENGDPIVILRNNQYDDGKDPWVPQVEDINKQGSSVYLTSTQIIPLEASSTSYKSYSTSPTNPNQFAGEQIILNSGRLVFNTKEDHLLLSSAKSINLNAVDSVNIDSPKTILQSNNVYLGDKNATESVILGDKFLTDLSKLLTNIIALSTALQTPVGTPAPFVPNVAIPGPAVQVTQTATQMLNKIQTYKSKVSKTK
jgi:hypothetical protein